MADESSGELLQCVGTLEVEKPKAVGFICGTLPVPTDQPFHAALVVPSSSISPKSTSSSSSPKVAAPRYRLIPADTDLNRPPIVPDTDENFFTGYERDKQLESSYQSQSLSRKCEALAISGLAEYGDEIDVVAPAEIMKQIFKIPYSKARLSIAVHRIGHTLILNSGPDVEEGENHYRRKKNQPKVADQSLFLNFAMHSVRAEACDCPPSKSKPSDKSTSSTILPGHAKSEDDVYVPSINSTHSDYLQEKKDNYFWDGKQRKRHDALDKASELGGSSRHPIQESERPRRFDSDGFLRALFWQFHNFRVLLGSDLLLVSNEKYTAVSLHLWDISRQITPIMWLEAWLDNVMASVPELAVCYHRNGVVQGYELLKTEDVYLLKGISDEGTFAFHPQVVQENGLSVLRFLRDNCKQDPGAYWLFKSSGEDVIQLFDLSIIPKNHSPDTRDKGCPTFSSLVNRRRDSLTSLGTLIYRLAHRLSLSRASKNRSKCAKLFKKCLEVLSGQEHLVVRAYAHEQFARLILDCYNELDLTFGPFLEHEATVTTVDADNSSSRSCTASTTVNHDSVPSCSTGCLPSTEGTGASHDSPSEVSERPVVNAESCDGIELLSINECSDETGKSPVVSSEDLAVYDASVAPQFIQTVPDPISSKLAAVHHVSQAIKSLRWKRQLQNAEGKDAEYENTVSPPKQPSSVCLCGDSDCIEVCDIREWLPRSKMDSKLWKLVLLLGESYLALGESYKEDSQLDQTLKVVELACSVYGSMPPILDDAHFISSIVCEMSKAVTIDNETCHAQDEPVSDFNANYAYDPACTDHLISKNVFWAKAWALVGDVYVEYHKIHGKRPLLQSEQVGRVSSLKMSKEVVKEVKRLKKKLSQLTDSCDTCSLINCSCQGDRVSSGNSASSSNSTGYPSTSSKKQRRKSQKKAVVSSAYRNHDTMLELSRDENNHNSANIELLGGKSHMDITAKESDTEKKIAQNPDTVEKVTGAESKLSGPSCTSAEEISDPHEGKYGGIFTYLDGPIPGDVELNLSVAIYCYSEASKAVAGISCASEVLQSAVKKKGWACNELGRYRLESGDVEGSEFAFVDGIKAFKEVSDHTNIILIYCNLGHGKRALAEARVTKIESMKSYGAVGPAFKQVVEKAVWEYSESLRFYSEARSELTNFKEEIGSASVLLSNEVSTQYAHTYLKLGMLLAREDLTAEIYETGRSLNAIVGCSGDNDAKLLQRDHKMHEISASDAIREAIHIYESLGDLRGQETAFAYFQLACHQKDMAMKFMDREQSQSKVMKSEPNHLAQLKRYASLADKNWQRAIDFYGPKTHPQMYLTILLERSIFSLKLSYCLQPNTMLESALHHLLEGRHVVEEGTDDSLGADHSNVKDKFFNQLQLLLKKMLGSALSWNTHKLNDLTQGSQNKINDLVKLKEMYRQSLKANGLSGLYSLYKLWIS